MKDDKKRKGKHIKLYAIKSSIYELPNKIQNPNDYYFINNYWYIQITSTHFRWKLIIFKKKFSIKTDYRKMTKKKNKLQELGVISHITSTNKLIIPSNKTPRIGTTLVNKNRQAIGRINDIIGPTKNPYISVKTNHKFKKINVGEKAYLPPKNKGRRMRKRQAY